MSEPYDTGELGIELVIDQINAESNLTVKHKIAFNAAVNAIRELRAYGNKTISQYAAFIVEQRFGKIDWSDPIWLEI